MDDDPWLMLMQQASRHFPSHLRLPCVPMHYMHAYSMCMGRPPSFPPAPPTHAYMHACLRDSPPMRRRWSLCCAGDAQSTQGDHPPPPCMCAFTDAGLFAALEARSLHKEIILLLGSANLMLIPLLQVRGRAHGERGAWVSAGATGGEGTTSHGIIHMAFLRAHGHMGMWRWNPQSDPHPHVLLFPIRPRRL